MDSLYWTSYNAAQSEEKRHFVVLLSDLCKAVPPQTGRGRPRLSLPNMLFASTCKVYVGFSSRRFTSDLHDAYAGGLIDSYHRRSSVKSVFSMVNAKFGNSIRSKRDTGQVKEAMYKILCHNICVLIHATHSLSVDASFAPNNVAYLPTR